jgi:rod shape-determining protein MreB
VLAIGREATDLIGRTTNPIRAVSPILQGAVADFDITVRMLRYVLRAAGTSRFNRPKVLLTVPGTATPIERRALLKAASDAGASSARLLEQPMAAAMELGLPFDEPVGTMVCDLGGGKSEVAVLSLGGMVALRALRVGGGDLDEAIASHVRTHYGVVIALETASAVKVAIGSVAPFSGEHELELQGRRVATGHPETVVLAPDEVRAALEDPVAQILHAAVQCLADAPPELSQDIIFHGIHLVGGGSLLRGLEARLALATDVPVHAHDRPDTVIVLGAGRCLDDVGRYAALYARASG